MTPRPFTVIAGFLGAGKSTLVNRILCQAEGTRFAVLVNDFGAVNVDAGLIAHHDGQTLALTNGCICCSMVDGFIQTMLRLMAEPHAFDHVIVEASGVAEPERIMDFARLDPQLAPDAILTLTDAETVADRLGDPHVGQVVASQIGAADIILLNKLDLAADPGAVEVVLRARNPIAPILRCRSAALPLSAILGTNLAADSATRAAPSTEAAFHTATYRTDGPLDPVLFEQWTAGLPTHILRGKGRVELTNGCMIWQRVGLRQTLTPSASPGPSEIVLISAHPLDNVPPLQVSGDTASSPTR